MIAFCIRVPEKDWAQGGTDRPRGPADAELTRGWLRGGRGALSKRHVCIIDQGNSRAYTIRVSRRYTVILGALAVLYAGCTRHRARDRGGGRALRQMDTNSNPKQGGVEEVDGPREEAGRRGGCLEGRATQALHRQRQPCMRDGPLTDAKGVREQASGHAGSMHSVGGWGDWVDAENEREIDANGWQRPAKLERMHIRGWSILQYQSSQARLCCALG